MKFFDEAKVFLKAGNGGNGKCSFRHEKYVEFGGPDGGNGGKGGDIILRANRNNNTLIFLHKQPKQIAENGKNGDKKNRTGASAENKIIDVPLGTQIFDESGEVLLFDLIDDKQDVTIAHGGEGGLGNAMFKTSTNQAPRKTTDGEKGEEGIFKLRLKLISDVGLVGFPNAGKSSFISSVTNLKPKIADYPFTTIKPALGVAEVFDKAIVLCDIPGLIENAHKGTGLGDKFLQHIERCKVILHLVDITCEDPVRSYTTIRNELLLYNKELAKKPEIVALSKCDLIDEEMQKMILGDFKRQTKVNPILLCSYDENLRNAVLKKIYELISGY